LEPLGEGLLLVAWPKVETVAIAAMTSTLVHLESLFMRILSN
jgi:hypothetical protein